MVFLGSSEFLTFGELGRAAGGFEAVLFAFLHTGIAGEEAGFFQFGAEFGVHFAQGAADAVTDSTGLAGQTPPRTLTITSKFPTLVRFMGWRTVIFRVSSPK